MAERKPRSRFPEEVTGALCWCLGTFRGLCVWPLGQGSVTKVGHGRGLASVYFPVTSKGQPEAAQRSGQRKPGLENRGLLTAGGFALCYLSAEGGTPGPMRSWLQPLSAGQVSGAKEKGGAEDVSYSVTEQLNDLASDMLLLRGV